MKILMTNNTLLWRSGTELYVRDIALALRHRGHIVIAYSSELGPIAEEMRDLGIAVVDDLYALTEAPDVIHGHHHLDAAAAALRFPSVPVVNVCHGWTPWQEAPLPYPLASRYVAVSALTRERLVTSGIPIEVISIIPNFVDTARFGTVRPSDRPLKRALAYGNSWRIGEASLEAIRDFCLEHRLEFEAVGGGIGNGTACPEDTLPTFDVVFAMGRSALEAMASGCAVIVADPKGMDGLVTIDTIEHQSNNNFGLALVAGTPVTHLAISEAIDAIAPHKIAEVTSFVRQKMDIEHAVDLLETQYQLAIGAPLRSKSDLIDATQKYLVQQKARNFFFENNYSTAKNRADFLELQSVSTVQRLEMQLTTLQDELLDAVRDRDAAKAAAELQSASELAISDLQEALLEAIRDRDTTKAAAELRSASELAIADSALKQAQQRMTSLEQHLVVIYGRPWLPWRPYLKRLVARMLARATRRKWPAQSARFIAAAERRRPERLVNEEFSAGLVQPMDSYGIATQHIIDRYLSSNHVTRKPLHLELGSGTLVRKLLDVAPADIAEHLNKPLSFSIVTPYYAHREYFAFCAQSVASIARSSAETFEWLVYNDDPSMSDDALLKLMPEEARERARILSDGTNHGIAVAQDLGVKAAIHPWILFLDCDDQLEPTALDTLSQHITLFPHCRYFTSLMTDMDENGATLRERRAESQLTNIFEAGMIAGHMVAFRRDLYDEVGGLNPHFSGVQDYDFALRVSAKEKIRRIPSYLYRYRWHGNSQSVGKSARQDKLADEVRASFLRNRLNVGSQLPLCRHELPDEPKTLCVMRTQGQRIELLTVAISSVLEQAHPFTPCVVVHGSQAVLEFVKKTVELRFTADKFHNIVFLHAPDLNRKRGYPCNVALDYLKSNLSKYQLLCFLDDDDYLLPTFSECLITLLRNTKSDFVYGASNAVPQMGEPFIQHRVLPFVALLGGPFITFNSFLVRSDAIVAANAKFDETIHYIEDYDFLIQLLSAGVKASASFDTVSEYRLIGDGNSGAPNDLKNYKECQGKVQRRLVDAVATLPEGHFLANVLDYPSRLREPLSPPELAHLRAAHHVYASRGNRA